MDNPKVFVSYSWDDPAHMTWVGYLTNELRKKGIDANFDRSITQKGTVNLNRMMVENFKNSDFIVVVLTENYAKRANEHTGGVGLETTFLENEILNNTKKIIPIKRSLKDDSKVVPYCLNGLNYTDFSKDDKFPESLNELLHRIYVIDQIEIEPLGEKPNLITKRIEYRSEINQIKPVNSMIPNFNKITDMDKKKYMQSSYNALKNQLFNLSKETESKNVNFHFEPNVNGELDYLIIFYLNGMEKTSIRLWMGNMMGCGSDSIFISYNNKSLSRNGWNEMITCEEINNSLKLKMTMNLFGRKTDNLDEIVESLWENICMYLK